MNTLPMNVEAFTKKAITQGAANAKAQNQSNRHFYMRFSKIGDWSWGPENIDVQEGSFWACDPMGFEFGFVCWETDPKKPSAKLGELMRDAMDPPIEEADLPDAGCPWKRQWTVKMICQNGQDKGTPVLFTSSSQGGVEAVGVLFATFIAQVKKVAPEGSQVFVPIVSLNGTSYPHPKYGEIHKPVLDVQKWGDYDTSPVGADEDSEKTKKVTTAAKRKTVQAAAAAEQVWLVREAERKALIAAAAEAAAEEAAEEEASRDEAAAQALQEEEADAEAALAANAAPRRQRRRAAA